MPKLLEENMTEEEKLKKRINRGTFDLDPDFFTGFKTSVRNGQALLALEYLTEYLTDLQNEIIDLKARAVIETPVAEKKTVSKKAVAEESQSGEQV